MVCKVYLISSHLFCAASFLGIIALTVDRFMAIHLHLRYQEFVTHKRVVAVVISVWVWCSCISLFVLNSVLENVLAIITVTIGTVCLTTTGFIYCKIYSIVRHHTNQIHALQLQPVGQNQNGELANAARLKKFCLLHFTCMWCLWFVFCPSYALTQLIKFMVSPSCGCICFIIRGHLYILIHLSILWSTAGRCETFDKL